MASFYEKLSMKLQTEGGSSAPQEPASGGAKSVSYNANGAKTAAAPKSDPPAGGDPAVAAPDPTPDGAVPLMVDLYQSDSRMVVFAQASGVPVSDFEILADEESNTLLIQATQKRPDLPSVAAQPGAEAEKGRYVKQEIAWSSLYRKVYLPAPFDAGEAETSLQHGVLIVVLPIKKPGVGKKLQVRESQIEEPKK